MTSEKPVCAETAWRALSLERRAQKARLRLSYDGVIYLRVGGVLGGVTLTLGALLGYGLLFTRDADVSLSPSGLGLLTVIACLAVLTALGGAISLTIAAREYREAWGQAREVFIARNT